MKLNARLWRVAFWPSTKDKKCGKLSIFFKNVKYSLVRHAGSRYSQKTAKLDIRRFDQNSVFQAWLVYAMLYELGVKHKIVALFIAHLYLVDEKFVAKTQKTIHAKL